MSSLWTYQSRHRTVQNFDRWLACHQNKGREMRVPTFSKGIEDELLEEKIIHFSSRQILQQHIEKFEALDRSDY